MRAWVRPPAAANSLYGESIFTAVLKTERLPILGIDHRFPLLLSGNQMNQQFPFLLATLLHRKRSSSPGTALVASCRSDCCRRSLGGGDGTRSTSCSKDGDFGGS